MSTVDHTPPVDEFLVDSAVAWAKEAGELTLEHFRSPDLQISHKKDGSPVTLADQAAEDLIRTRIANNFPQDSIVGEEREPRVGTSGRTWVIDPIDGTKAFSRGVGTYSNLIYVQDEHGPALGVINLPALGECIWGVRGEGCFFNGAPTAALSSSGRAPISPAERKPQSLEGQLLCVSSLSMWTPELFERSLNAGVQLRTWGDAYGYALVATGRANAMFDPELAWWDLAAVMVVIQESGGTITRIDGNPEVDSPSQDGPYGFSAIASDGSTHQDWVDLVAPDSVRRN